MTGLRNWASRLAAAWAELAEADAALKAIRLPVARDDAGPLWAAMNRVTEAKVGLWALLDMRRPSPAGRG